MHKVTVSRMRERYAQTALTFQITYVLMDDTLASNHLPVHDSRYSNFNLKSHTHNTFMIKFSEFLLTMKQVITEMRGPFNFMSYKRMVYIKCIQLVQGI